MILPVEIGPFLVGHERKQRELLLRRLEGIQAPLKGRPNGARGRGDQALHKDHEEADMGPFFAHGLVVAVADVVGDRLVESSGVTTWS